MLVLVVGLTPCHCFAGQNTAHHAKHDRPSTTYQSYHAIVPLYARKAFPLRCLVKTRSQRTGRHQLTEWVAINEAKNGQVEGFSQSVDAGAYGQWRKALAGNEN